MRALILLVCFVFTAMSLGAVWRQCDAATGKWEFLTGSSVYSSPAIGADGTIYVGSYDSKFYAINPDGT